MNVSDADNIVETSAFEGSGNQHEASVELQKTDQKVTLDESEEKLLIASFIIIRRHFKDALPHHIVLSFLLAFENVCPDFEVSSHKKQLDFVERCCDSVNAWSSTPPDCSYQKLKKSTLTKEIVLMICYLIVKLPGNVHYLNIIQQLKKIDFSDQDCRENAFTQADMSGICFEDISNSINFGRTGILSLRRPFTTIRKALKLKYTSLSSNYALSTQYKEDVFKFEVPEKVQITRKTLDKNWEELLNYSIIIIRRYFKDALLNNIVLSFLLAYKKVCANFALLCPEDQFDFLESCYCSIGANNNSPCDNNYNKRKSPREEEINLIICYLVVKSGGIHYIDFFTLLEKMRVQIYLKSVAFVELKAYFQRICNFINLSKKGFLTLKPPFSGTKRSLRNKCFPAFSSNYVPSYICSDNNSLCYQIPNENKNTSHEVRPSCSRYFHNQNRDCLEFQDPQTTIKEEPLD